MQKIERSFKGVWIPKEIWLSDNLTLQEKIFLVEIDSLDNSEGCFASNSYFSEFFGVSNSRSSQVIKSLKEKGYITVTFEKSGRQITKRILRINRPPYPHLENLQGIENIKDDIQFSKGGIKYSKGGIYNTKDGCLENCKDNNTVFNNTCNNKERKHKYGEYSHVLLSDTEKQKLFSEHGEGTTLKAIKYLDEYIETSGKKYKNHYLVMKKWVFDAVKESKPVKKNGFNNFTGRDYGDMRDLTIMLTE